MSDIKSIILDTPIQKLEDIISPFIAEQFPAFMRADHHKLILFIKAYYEWSESPENPGYVSSKLNTVHDIDKNLEQFYDHFKNVYMDSFPQILAINADGYSPNKKTLLKKIREFYGNKGTENAYRFLFRILYDSDLQIYSPKEDILKVSDGIWTEPKSVKTTSSSNNGIYGTINGTLTQYSENDPTIIIATAFIDNIVRYSSNGIPTTEFFLRDISGVFLPNKKITAKIENIEYEETTYSVLGEFFIETPGTGYLVGDNLFLVSDGVGFSARVGVTGLAGSIKKISIENSGINYFSEVSAIIISSTGANTASKVIMRPTAITNYPGYFYGNKGKISSNKRIQDGHYYQEYSYVLRSAISFDKYFSVLKSLTHPTGMKMFGSILMQSNLSLANDLISTYEISNRPIIGQYAPYTLDGIKDLRANGTNASGYTSSSYELVWSGLSGASIGNDSSTIQGTGISTPGGWGSGKAASVAGYTNSSRLEFTLDPLYSETNNLIAIGLGTQKNPTTLTYTGISYAWFMNNNTSSIQEGNSTYNSVAATPGITYSIEYKNGNIIYKRGGASIRTVPVTSGITLYANVALYSNTSKAYNINFYGFEFHGTTAGDLYPVGYNPFIYFNNTTIHGLTPATGTVYNGVTAGWTYDIVPETGTIVHNPLGYPLGSIQSNEISNEVTNNPGSIANLVLWLKPENISIRGEVKNGATMDIWRDASTTGNHAIPPTWDRWTNNVAYLGVTVDRLCPTLVISDNGVVGATGISFDGGVIFGPQTIWSESSPPGLSLGSAALGITFAPGSSGDKMLVGRHFYLTNGLTLSADMDMFIVFRNTTDDYEYGNGLVSTNKRFTDEYHTLGDDSVIFSRSYNKIDRDPTLQNSTYYSIVDGVKLYGQSTNNSNGLFGFTPWKSVRGSATNATATSIVYDPHASGACMGMIIGEVSRDDSQTLYAYVNGDRAENRSPSTGIAVSTQNGLKAASSTPTSGFTLDIGRFGAYHKPTVSAGGTFGSTSWISGAIANNSYGFRGVINEVIVYDRQLKESERQGIYGYLSNKYKMESKLPDSYNSSHPTAAIIGANYWEIKHHPNTTSLAGVTLYSSVDTLVKPSLWTVGTGNVTYFSNSLNGADNESIRLLDYDPWGKTSVVWQAQSNGEDVTFTSTGTQTQADGGWNGVNFSIDRTKLYRFCVWSKVVRNTDAVIYIGHYGNTSILIAGRGATTVIGEQDANPYFSARNTVNYPLNEWVLEVGFVYPYTYGVTGVVHPDTGGYTISRGANNKLFSDFYGQHKWSPTQTTALQRVYLFYEDSAPPTSIVQFSEPRVEVVDGTEPSIADLLRDHPVENRIIPRGINFGNISIGDFSNSPTATYKSKGYEISPGVYLSQDTYLDL